MGFYDVTGICVAEKCVPMLERFIFSMQAKNKRVFVENIVFVGVIVDTVPLIITDGKDVMGTLRHKYSVIRS